jgi:hypothetical protein
MVVRTECEGRRVTGIYIGARNVRRNFRKEAAVIEFELGHLQIDCELGPGFWRDEPRICDSRLCDWLEFRFYRERKYMAPLPLVLVQSGRNAFKVRPMVLPSISLIGIGEWHSGGWSRQPQGKTAGAGLKLHHPPAFAATTY